MNRTGIEWTDLTWNPITGCRKGCPYCYARRMAYRLRGRMGYPEDDPFQPLLHTDRLDEPLEIRKPKLIFPVSMGDIFGEGVPEEWIFTVFDRMRKAKQHLFQVLTKCPENIPGDLEIPDNVWMGVSVSSGWDMPRFALLMDQAVVGGWKGRTFISVEPLHGGVYEEGYYGPGHRLRRAPPWVIIGAETGNRADKIIPTEKALLEWVYWAGLNNARVFFKNSLRPLVESMGQVDNPSSPVRWRTEMPEAMEAFRGRPETRGTPDDVIHTLRRFTV